MVYRFIDINKEYFGLIWLCRKFDISPNGYYNYLKDSKGEYHEQRDVIYERIKYIFFNNNRTVGHKAMRIFLSRYGIHLSKTTVHKYMNKTLNLAAIIMRKKPGYTSGKKHNITQSMSKAGCPYDNAPMERFYNTFKSCFYYRFTYESVEMLDEMTKEYIICSIM